MKRILKYEIPISNIGGITEVVMLRNSNFLCFKNQKGKLFLWVEAMENEENELRKFVLLHTGDYLPDNPIYYLQTVLFDEGNYVIHVYLLK